MGHQSESVVAGSNGDGSRQLQPDDGNPSAVDVVGSSMVAMIFMLCWFLNYVIFTLINVSFGLSLF